jgi:type I restriction enzyme R subunit
MPDLYGLKTDVIDKVRTALAGFAQIHSAILYGSRAKGNYKPGSDIDLTLVTDRDLPNNFLNRVLTAIDDLDLIYTFDISLLHQIDNANLLDHIQRVGVEFYNAREYTQKSKEHKSSQT